MNKFWIRLGIWWFTFRRWQAKQMTFAYFESGKHAESQAWWEDYKKYDAMLGRILAKQLSDKVAEVIKV